MTEAAQPLAPEREALAHKIMENFVAKLRAEFPEHWPATGEGGVDPEELCDANMVIADSFQEVVGRMDATGARVEREAAAGDDEAMTAAQEKAEADDLELWNRAVWLFNHNFKCWRKGDARPSLAEERGPPPLLECGLTAPREARPARSLGALERQLQLLPAGVLDHASKRMAGVLVEAEAALYEGWWNCGFETDSLWAEPLAKVQDILDKLEKGERL